MIPSSSRILITCTDRGSLSFWPPEEKKVSSLPPPLSSSLPPPLSPSLLLFLHPFYLLNTGCCLSRVQWEREVGKETCCMAVTDSPDSRVATGGRENPLKLWDTSQQSHTPIFTAKNVSFLNVCKFLTREY